MVGQQQRGYSAGNLIPERAMKIAARQHMLGFFYLQTHQLSVDECVERLQILAKK